MKKLFKFLISTLCAVALTVPVALGACTGGGDEGGEGGGGTTTPEFIDYVSQLKLDMTSETKKQEVTVRLYVDGDTTHFDPVKNSNITPNVDLSAFAVTQNYIKARYVAINTPESTGRIEKWGKTASNFTHDKLESCANGGSIIVESEDENWNADSTGGRFVLWVWYRPAGETEYRNLNVEILQEGLALMSSTANSRYGEIGVKALNQAITFKKHVYSPPNTVDVNFYEGDAIPVTLKELRCHVEDYLQKTVRVEGTVVAYFENTIYIQDHDAETDTYFGMSVFDGYSTGTIISLFKIGNRVSVCGSVTEFQGTYQISGIGYDIFHPNAPENSQKLGEGYEVVYSDLDAKNIVSGDLDVKFEYEDEEIEDETVTLEYGDAVTSTAVELKDLKVTKTYATHNGGNNDGAISITCTAPDGTEITVRTTVLKVDGVVVDKSIFDGKTIDVKGVVEKYTPDYKNKPDEYSYQLKCFLLDYITIH